jgi:hypothetical protein
MNGMDMNKAVNDALTSLEYNSSANTSATSTPITPIASKAIPSYPPPQYKDIGRISFGANAPLGYQNQKTPVIRNPLAPRKRSTYPPKSALKTSRNNSGSNTPRDTPTIAEASELPEVPAATATTEKSHKSRRTSSLELITLAQRPACDPRRILDMSLKCDTSGDNGSMTGTNKNLPVPGEAGQELYPIGVVRPPSSAYSQDVNSAGVSRQASTKYSDETTSSDAREAVVAREEFRRFSFEMDPVSPLEQGRRTN